MNLKFRNPKQFIYYIYWFTQISPPPIPTWKHGTYKETWINECMSLWGGYYRMYDNSALTLVNLIHKHIIIVEYAKNIRFILEWVDMNRLPFNNHNIKLMQSLDMYDNEKNYNYLRLASEAEWL